MGTPKAASAKSLTFDFAEITEEEVLNLVPPSHASKYSQIRLEVANHLLKNPAPFKFPKVPMNPELPEKERRGICHAVNGELAGRKINWSITYSGIGKCFVVRPFKRWKARKTMQPKEAGVFSTRSVAKIDRPLEISKKMKPIIAAAESAWGLDWKDIMKRRAMKWAVAVVAVNDREVDQEEVAKAFGTTNWSVHGFVKKESVVKEEVESLRKKLR